MEKDKALDAALSQIERAFGKGSIMRLGQNPNVDIEAISTGSLGIDIALGIGGLPKGRIIEIYGPESSGKTTLALSVIAQSQKKGGTCAFIDAEHALDPSYAKKIGVDIDNLLISQPDAGDRLWKSPIRWFAPALSMFWLSTLSPLWFPKPNLKAKWAILTWVCKPA